MNEQEWEKLKKYLDNHRISYETEYVYITGRASAFMIKLPLIVIENKPAEKGD